MRDRRGAGARGTNEAQFRMRGGDLHYTLPVEFLEAVSGAKKRVDMPDGKTLDIAIPPGVEDRQTLRLKGQGRPGLGGGPSGDALITVMMHPHPVFRREGNDIKSVLPVTLDEALSGGTVQTETITGPVSVKIPKHSNTGRVLRLRGKGVQGKVKGDHLIELQVVLPPHPDDALEKAVSEWESQHPYNPRGVVR
jgi:DnaJ-class molecular chaperone